jgi:hypothetical protein
MLTSKHSAIEDLNDAMHKGISICTYNALTTVLQGKYQQLTLIGQVSITHCCALRAAAALYYWYHTLHMIHITAALHVYWHTPTQTTSATHILISTQTPRLYSQDPRNALPRLTRENVVGSLRVKLTGR